MGQTRHLWSRPVANGQDTTYNPSESFPTSQGDLPTTCLEASLYRFVHYSLSIGLCAVVSSLPHCRSWWGKTPGLLDFLVQLHISAFSDLNIYFCDYLRPCSSSFFCSFGVFHLLDALSTIPEAYGLDLQPTQPQGRHGQRPKDTGCVPLSLVASFPSLPFLSSRTR